MQFGLCILYRAVVAAFFISHVCYFAVFLQPIHRTIIGMDHIPAEDVNFFSSSFISFCISGKVGTRRCLVFQATNQQGILVNSHLDESDNCFRTLLCATSKERDARLNWLQLQWTQFPGLSFLQIMITSGSARRKERMRKRMLCQRADSPVFGEVSCMISTGSSAVRIFVSSLFKYC